jgi:hypothetical protein
VVGHAHRRRQQALQLFRGWPGFGKQAGRDGSALGQRDESGGGVSHAASYTGVYFAGRKRIHCGLRPREPGRLSQIPSSRSVSSTEALARLRDKAGPTLTRAFDDALGRTEQWLEQFAAKQAEKLAEKQLDKEKEKADKEKADDTAKDRDTLRQGRRAACEVFERKWQSSVSALMIEADAKWHLEGLSLVDDESLDLQLAHESFVESLSKRYRAGIEALDQRLALVLGVVPMGKKMPLSADAMATAASAGIQGFDVEAAIRGLAFRHFEEALETAFQPLLKDLNGWLAAAGVLPHLVVPDVEERRRPGAKAGSADEDEAAEEPARLGATAPAHESAAPARISPPEDRAMFQTLVGLLQNLNAQRQAHGGIAVPAPTGKPLESEQTISVLDMLQREPPADVLAALSAGGGSLADVLKRHVAEGAQRLGIDKDESHLAPAEETAVDLVGNLFDVMARERPYGEVAKPLLGRMVMPFTKAAVMDPELFAQPEHPARKLLNTVSEACEDNLGESAQDRELLGHVEQAIDQLNAQFDNDLTPFESIEKTLSGQMVSHRRRVGLAERREAEAQRGQERLELARGRAADVVQQCLHGREMPSAIREFLVGHWQHHLTMVALRQPEDSPTWREAASVARPWLDYCDMASLGEPIPAERLETLRPSTEAALASSGVHGQAAELIFDGMRRALTSWAESGGELPAVEVESAAIAPAESRFAPTSEQRPSPESLAKPVAPVAGDALAAAPLMKPADAKVAPADALEAMLAEKQDPPTEEELAEMRALPMNVWLQLPKSANELQVVKLSWVSGISGLMMFVNRRGARVLVASPAEMALWKRQGRVLLFERNAPVDQAMAQVVDRLRRQVSAA